MPSALLNCTQEPQESVACCSADPSAVNVSSATGLAAAGRHLLQSSGSQDVGITAQLPAGVDVQAAIAALQQASSSGTGQLYQTALSK